MNNTSKSVLSVVVIACAVVAVVFAGCDSKDNSAAPEMSPDTKAMYKLYREINKREKIKETVIDVQYLVIKDDSDGHLGKRKKLSLEEAELKAVELLKKAQDGYDFELLVLEEDYTDFAPGELAGHVRIVTTKEELEANQGARLRSGYAPHFQTTVFRLKLGEIAVVPYHNKGAPKGNYVVRRLPDGLIDGLVDKSSLSESEQKMIELADETLARDEIADNQVTIQHILIGHARIKGKKKYLTRKAASKLAAEVLKKAQAGEDFNELVKEYSYDYNENNPSGEYKLFNKEATGSMAKVEGNKRDSMVKHFGDVAYRLKVGEIGVAVKSLNDSPYGFHIIKRIK
ncbi:MAG: peptidyl-prolyl cis-trans isomerase [Planctomycetes bacterium]|nr:peptidyl-prolyl cis-trans isomerase [Planctomycetota bacterium]